MKLLVIFLTVFLCHIVGGKPFLSDYLLDELPGDVRHCHGLMCPEGTAGCVKNVTTTNDLRTVRIHLVCEDSNGRELLSDLRLEPNQREGVNVESYSFHGNYIHTGPGSNFVRINSGNVVTHEYDAVETFE